jgi:hypothetical protein
MRELDCGTARPDRARSRKVGVLALLALAAAAISSVTRAQSRELCSVVSPEFLRVANASLSTDNGAKQHYEAALKDFVVRPTALAELSAARRYAERHQIRTMLWMTVFIASNVHSDESVDFLTGIALKPTKIPASVHEQSKPFGNADEPGTSWLPSQLVAVRGIAEQYAAGVANAPAAVDDVFRTADPELVRMLGAELYARGLLREQHRPAIEARGVYANFRRLSDAEIAAQSVGDMRLLRSPQKPVRSNAWNPPPTEQE